MRNIKCVVGAGCANYPTKKQSGWLPGLAPNPTNLGPADSNFKHNTKCSTVRTVPDCNLIFNIPPSQTAGDIIGRQNLISECWKQLEESFQIGLNGPWMFFLSWLFCWSSYSCSRRFIWRTRKRLRRIHRLHWARQSASNVLNNARPLRSFGRNILLFTLSSCWQIGCKLICFRSHRLDESVTFIPSDALLSLLSGKELTCTRCIWATM